MEFKPNAFICEHGHITKISRQKLRFTDGMLCPECKGHGNLCYEGIDFNGGDNDAPKN